ncbi:MAG: hypothetical protein K2G87_00540, partial [Oscillospiraceae bacterium]|nr:hypothetical protein [Oscillospiraceae bacterium]
SMNQIKELAAMLSGGMNDPSESFSAGTDAPGDTALPSFGGIDLSAIMQLLGALSSDDKDCGLLLALRPHLSEEKQKRLDKAVKLIKLYNVFTTIRESGMLSELENML